MISQSTLPLLLSSRNRYLLQLLTQATQSLKDFLALLLISPSPAHRGQFPSIFQAVKKVDLIFEVRDVVSQVLSLAVLGLDFLALLQILRVEVLDIAEAEIRLEFGFFCSCRAFEIQRGLEF